MRSCLVRNLLPTVLERYTVYTFWSVLSVNHRDWTLGAAVWIITNTTIMTPLGDAYAHPPYIIYLLPLISFTSKGSLVIKTERKLEMTHTITSSHAATGVRLERNGTCRSCLSNRIRRGRSGIYIRVDILFSLWDNHNTPVESQSCSQTPFHPLSVLNI
jgi:hypothetical protein